jgi:small subunit ribosomal protein S20
MKKNKSALKALRKSKKRYLYNKKIKEGLNYLERKLKKAIAEKKIEEAKTFYHSFQKAVDKAWQKGVLKKNTAGRKKSRLAKKLNNLLKQTKA